MDRMTSIALALSVGAAAPLAAQPIPLGGEITVNSTTAGDQRSPQVAADGAGNFRIVWQTAVGDPAHWDVRIRRLGANGTLGTDSALAETATGNQTTPAIDLSDGGDWVAAWLTDHGPATEAQVFGRATTAGGTLLGAEFDYFAEGGDDAALPAVAAIGEDLFVGAWRADGDGGVPKARLRSRPGVIFSIAEPGPGSGSNWPSVAGLFEQSWAAAWTTTDADGGGVLLRCYDLSQPVTPAFLAAESEAGDQLYPDIASGDGGRFVVVWQEEGEIRARTYVDDGFGCDATSFEIDVDSPQVTGLYPRVDMAADGGFVVAWYANSPDTDGGVLLREFSPRGRPLGPPTPANVTTLGPQASPDVALSERTLTVVWTSPDSGAAGPANVVARRYARAYVFAGDFEEGDVTAWSGGSNP